MDKSITACLTNNKPKWSNLGKEPNLGLVRLTLIIHIITNTNIY